MNITRQSTGDHQILYRLLRSPTIQSRSSMCVTQDKYHPRKNIADILSAQKNNAPNLRNIQYIQKRELNLIMKDQNLLGLIIFMVIKILNITNTSKNCPTKTRKLFLPKRSKQCIPKTRKHCLPLNMLTAHN